MRFTFLAVLSLVVLVSGAGYAQTSANPGISSAIINSVANMTPQQRQQYLDIYNKMTPEQKKALADQAQNTWQNVTPAQKESLKNQALQQWQKITPEEKQVLTKQAQDKWMSMTPQEKQQLTNQFGSLLGGAAPAR